MPKTTNMNRMMTTTTMNLRLLLLLIMKMIRMMMMVIVKMVGTVMRILNHLLSFLSNTTFQLQESVGKDRRFILKKSHADFKRVDLCEGAKLPITRCRAHGATARRTNQRMNPKG